MQEKVNWDPTRESRTRTVMRTSVRCDGAAVDLGTLRLAVLEESHSMHPRSSTTTKQQLESTRALRFLAAASVTNSVVPRDGHEARRRARVSTLGGHFGSLM